MALTINELELKGFRNYEHFLMQMNPGISIVVGPNAVGKTNLLEAIQLVTAGESFRRPKWIEVVKENEPAAAVNMKASGDGQLLDVSLKIENNRREYTINEKRKRPKDLLGRIPCVVFTPDDLFMIKGPAEERRRTIDEAGDQLSASYARLRTTYSRLLKQRNAALRAETVGQQMDVLDEQIVDVGAKLTAHRARLSNRLATKAAVLYSNMAGNEELSVELQPSWVRLGVPNTGCSEDEARTALTKALSKAAREERARMLTTVGPHRDDLVFKIGGVDARTYASQGQQRSAALAWKLAEVGVIEDLLGNRPILLLDDVMSELDKSRRSALTEVLSYTTQTLITTANLQYFAPEMLSSTTVVELAP